MDSILRGAATYLFVWAVFRLAGKRSLAQITTFDAVLVLIISETTQAALVDNDNSMTNSFLLILTLVSLDIGLSHLRNWFPKLGPVMDGAPLVILDENGFDNEAMQRERLDKDEILQSARERQGLANTKQIAYAVLEPSGGITVVPKNVGEQQK
jgi:uncharacterized membrane protein YcaP (DUF421 family)